MPIYKLKLIDKREVARGTLVFTFEKPAGFTFKPGQYGGFTLIDPSETDEGGNTRRFSLLSTPDDEHIEIVTRIQSSAFKRVLSNLPSGSEVKFAGPTGTFTLHEDASPTVLIAGGIGIAPFYSMIRYAATHPARPITLFYGNQSVGDTAFLQELTALQNPNFKLVATMANPDRDWQGETGFITDSMIRQHVSDLSAPIYYICGSPNMVRTLQEILAEMDIHEDRIKVEDFPGY